MCSWYEAGARATKGETCADQMTDSFQAHKDDAAIFEPCWPLSQARGVRSALVNRLVFGGDLYCLHFLGRRSRLRKTVGPMAECWCA